MTATDAPSIDVGELMITAASCGSEFADVQVVTAVSEYVRLAQERALEEYIDAGHQRVNAKKVESRAIQLINEGSIRVRSHVTIDRGNVTVCVHAAAVDDETALRAIEMTSKAIASLDGNDGTVYFGEYLTFGLSDIPWLRRH